MEHINVCHIFFYSRIIELIDTLWIVLRKKNRQITFLHVFHHSFVLLMTWFYFRIAPGGSSAMFPIVNGMVHTVMYAYYTLSTFDSLKPYLWWKKYVTRIQLTQFIILGLHFTVAALTPDCGYPRILSLTGLGISCMFFTLFITFYRQTYIEQRRRKLETSTGMKLKREHSPSSINTRSNNNKLNNLNNNNNYINNNNNYNHKINEYKSN